MMEENNSPFFATSLKGLDEALGGGIPFSSITELVGPTRSGKTQFCLTLLMLTTFISRVSRNIELVEENKLRRL